MFKKTIITTVSLSALLVLSAVGSAHAQNSASSLPEIKFCTGLPGLNYEFVGQEVRKQSKDILNIKVINSKGSMDNLQMLESGACDVAVVQMDALNIYAKASSVEIGAVLYQEMWHLVCNKNSGITRITQLTPKNKIYIGPNGGGTSVTWASFVKADPNRYKDVKTEPGFGNRAAGLTESDGNNCMAVVAGLNSKAIKDLSESAKNNDVLRLVPSNDGDILKAVDEKNRRVYNDVEIPSGTYRGYQPRSITGSSVATVSVNAVIVGSSRYIDNDSISYDKFLTMVAKAMPSIKEHVEPK